MKRFAEDMNYFDTTVAPAKSQAEIVAMLDAFGAASIMIAQGKAGEKFAWMIRFMWEDRSYRFVFTPLPCRSPLKDRSFGGKRRSFAEQAKWQMGRIAVNFVKAILTAAEAQPTALFGFMEIAGTGRPGGLPAVAGDLDPQALASRTALLPDGIVVDGEVE